MTGYTNRRQSYFTDDIVEAIHTNDEYNHLLDVFDEEIGHRHDGSEGEGGLIPVVSDLDGDTKIHVEQTPDIDTIAFYSAGVKVMEMDTNGLVFGGSFRLTYNHVSETLDIVAED